MCNEKADPRPWYDTQEGIEAKIATDGYAAAYEALQLRATARERGEELQNGFVLFGTLVADKLGNCGRATLGDGSPMSFGTFASHVTDIDEALEASAEEGGRSGYGFGSESALRPPQVLCAACGKGWSLAESGDYACQDRDNSVPIGLDAHVGKTLAQVQELLDGSTEGTFHLLTDVRNDRWIISQPTDRRRDYETEGWRTSDSTQPQITMDYVVQPGDEVACFGKRFLHLSCYASAEAEAEKENAAQEIEAFTAMFTDAGFSDVKIELTALPAHLVSWIMSEETQGLDPNDTPEVQAQTLAEMQAQMLKELKYWKVSTDVGTVGIWVAAYPALDLHGTGISARDLYPGEGDGADASEADMLPDIAGFDGNPATLLRLWQLLKKQSEKKS